MTFKEFYLRESPDRVSNSIWWKSKDSRTFGYINNKFFISNQTTNHPDFTIELLNSKKIKIQDLPEVAQKSGLVGRIIFKYPGRLWTDSKIISFWKFPTKSDFDKLIQDVKNSGINIDNSWKVDVEEGPISVLEPITNYSNKFQDIKIKQVDHILDPITKDILKKGGKNSTYKTDLKIPKGMTMAQYNNMKMTSENLDESVQSQLAKQAGLKHVGHGIYRNQDGDEFKWNGNAFKQIESRFYKEKEFVQKSTNGSNNVKLVDLKSLSGDKIKDLDYHVFLDNIIKAYKDNNFDVIKHVAKELNRPYELALQDIKSKINESVPTTVAPTSVSNGQYAGKPMDVGKRKEPKLITDIKDRVKKKLKDKYSKKEKK